MDIHYQSPLHKLLNPAAVVLYHLPIRFLTSSLFFNVRHRCIRHFLVLLQQSACISWFHWGHFIQCLYDNSKMPFWLQGSEVLPWRDTFERQKQGHKILKFASNAFLTYKTMTWRYWSWSVWVLLTGLLTFLFHHWSNLQIVSPSLLSCKLVWM